MINAIEIVQISGGGVPINVAPIANQVFFENEPLDGSLAVNATGGDGNLQYSEQGLPPGLTLEPTNGVIGGTPAVGSSAGSPYVVTITVDDSDALSSDQVSITFNITILESLASQNWVDKNEDESYTARHECSFVQAGDKFYLMGGRENSRTLDIYDYSSNSWNSLVDSSPVEFNHFQATEYEGLIWVIGAFKDNVFPNEAPADNIWAFDPVAQIWIQGPTIPAGRKRGSAGLVIYNDKFYIVGGNTIGHNGGFVPWFDEYDPATGTWTTLTDAPRARDHFHAVVIGNKLYAAGGRLSGGAGGTSKPVIPEVDVYDFSTGNWSTLPSGQNLPTPRAAAATVNYNDKLVVIGGEVREELVYGVLTTDALKITEEYDPATSTWTRLADLNFERHGTQGIVSGNGIFVTAGSPNLGGGNQHNMEYLVEDAPVGNPSTASTLSSPASLDIPFGSTADFDLDVAGGNVGLLVTSYEITGPDATNFTVNSGLANGGLLKTNISQTVTIANTGSTIGESATLTINYSPSGSTTISLNTIDNPSAQGVVSFTMVNADTDQDMFGLTDGMQIDEGTVQDINLSIRANTNPAVVGSVYLDLTGPLSNDRTENVAPYTLFGDSGGGTNYSGNLFPLGNYTMSATAYSGSGQGGSVLGTLTINFTITDQAGGVPPTLTNPGSQTNTEGDAVALQIQASSSNGSLTYSASGLPPDLSIDPNSGLISGTISDDAAGNMPFIEQNGLVVIENESGTIVPTWSATAVGGANGIVPGTNHFATQDGGTIPYNVTITTPGVYWFRWRTYITGTDPSSSNDNWLRFPNNNDVWFFGMKNAGDEASIIANLQGAQTDVVFPVGSSRNTPATSPDGASSNGYFKVYRGGLTEQYVWRASTSDGDPHLIYVWFVNPGTYTFEVSERSAGNALDKMALIYVDGPSYGNNELTAAAESPRGGAAAGSPYSAEVTVTDQFSPPLSTTEQFTWTVNPSGPMNMPPTAIATASPTSGDAPLQVNFTGSNSTDDNGIVSYSWDFGDGGTSNAADPSYTYSSDGIFTATLTVTDGVGLTDSDSVVITVDAPTGNQPPNAVASANPVSGDAPLQVNFTGSNSTDDTAVVSYSWDFGDGGSSTMADPQYTYNTLGGYTATLTVTDGEGLTDTATVPINVTDPNQQGVISFTLINADTDTDFFDLSHGMQIDESTTQGINLSIRANTNPAVVGSVVLDLTGPESNTRTEGRAPYALYGDSGSNYNGVLFPSGNYTMSATAYSGSGGSGTNLGSLTVLFSIGPGTGNNPPTAIATGTPTSGDAPLQVNFTGSNSTDDNGIVSYSWSFGDGGSSNSADPSYTYNNAGNFTATLTVTDGEGLTDSDSVVITVNDPTVNQPPNAVASGTPLSGDAPLLVTFTGSNSTDDTGIVSYSWVFGDGGTSNSADPQYTYNSFGNYTAVLTVTDGAGLTDTANVPITVTDPAQQGVVSFTLVNADTDVDLFDITEGMQIDESITQGVNLNIRANTNPGVVGSVFLDLTGPVSNTRTEGRAPYALYGDSNGNYNGVPFPTGSYTMSATAYSGSGLSGTNLGSLTTNFSIVSTGGKSALSDTDESLNDLLAIELYPNPTASTFNIQVSEGSALIKDVYLFDMSGRLIKKLNSIEIIQNDGLYTFDTYGMEEGIYYVKVLTTTQEAFNYPLVVRK